MSLFLSYILKRRYTSTNLHVYLASSIIILVLDLLLAYQSLWFPSTLAPLENINTIPTCSFIGCVIERAFTSLLWSSFCLITNSVTLLQLHVFLFAFSRSVTLSFLFSTLLSCWHFVCGDHKSLMTCSIEAACHTFDILSKSAKARNPAASV